jgi:DNA-binding MarR family transcriptional regulator
MLLAAATSMSFHEMQKEAKLTAGNLQSHLKSLEAAGYVEAWRSLIDLKPRMRYRLTPEGAAALKRYCAQLAEVVRGIESLRAPPAEEGPTRSR